MLYQLHHQVHAIGPIERTEALIAFCLFVTAAGLAVRALFRWIVRPLRRPRPYSAPTAATWTDRDGTPVTKTPQGKLFDVVSNKNTCPDCGGKGFYTGPQGGMSVNVFCCNVKCRAGFNITPFEESVGVAERIHRGEVDCYPAQAFAIDGVMPDDLDRAKATLKEAEARLNEATVSILPHVV